MSDYKQNEATRFANMLATTIAKEHKMYRISKVEYAEFKSMCRVYAKEKGLAFDETREMFYVPEATK